MRRFVVLVVVALVAAGCSSSDDSGGFAVADCQRGDLDGRSVARVWDDVLLDSIRRDTPAPTVHARNLFHTSAAMWDAWAAYDPTADGYFVQEKAEADDVEAAREAAISYAAYRILLWRYSHANGLEATFEELANTMQSLCYSIDYVDTEGDSPAALGNRIAATVIEQGMDDGSLEDQRYVDTDYKPVNAPLVVADGIGDVRDPNRWQPLALARFVAQNGLPIPGAVQRFIGPHWGHVRSFALPGSDEGVPIDPGAPPQLGDSAEYKDEAIEVVRLSSELDPSDPTTIDISPGAMGDNPLGTNDGDGYTTNPVTGEPYEPNVVLRADYARVLAEFWADGPASETPPGHWNVIANEVSDTPGFEHRIGGAGDEVDRLEWDVKMYLTLNAAVHDAAVAAWGVKGFYDSARPITMIRYLGGRGELPLTDGLVEVITAESSAPGQRHEQLAEHIGETAVRTWAGIPDDPETQASGAQWMLATDWGTYQLPTFVTPAFAGYVSGHSTFSRAAAEVMTSFTGSPYFPGGLAEWTKDDLALEAGPTEPVTLQAASYYDAADQAGRSRLYGGIHISADDFNGRRIGAQCGKDAWARAQHFFDGTAA